MFNTILVLCTGNICRSPIAEGMFKRELEPKGKKVFSAGIAAVVGNSAHKHSLAVSEQNGLDISDHIAAQLNTDMVNQADLIIVMDQEHLSHMQGRYPQASGKTFLVGHWDGRADVDDPIRKPREAFDTTYAELEKYTQSWLSKI